MPFQDCTPNAISLLAFGPSISLVSFSKTADIERPGRVAGRRCRTPSPAYVGPGHLVGHVPGSLPSSDRQPPESGFMALFAGPHNYLLEPGIDAAN